MKWLQSSFLAALCAAALAPVGALADPVISRVSPLEGRLNRIVVIEGSGFGPVQGSNVVHIGDRQVPILSYSDGMITISVNPAVHDEPLALDTIYSLRVVTERLGKKSNAVDFKVLSGDPLTVIPAGSVPGAPDQPFINRLNDSLFCPGDILTLIGGGFGGTQGRGSVTINVPFLDAGGSVFFQPFGAVIHSWSDGVVAVSLVLPAGALPGNYTATVLRENGKSAAVAFTVGAIVNGACVIPTPQTGVDVADLDFGAQALNTTSAERTILLTNTSAVPLRTPDHQRHLQRSAPG
jgi:hypothetical protein